MWHLYYTLSLCCFIAPSYLWLEAFLKLRSTENDDVDAKYTFMTSSSLTLILKAKHWPPLKIYKPRTLDLTITRLKLKFINYM